MVIFHGWKDLCLQQYVQKDPEVEWAEGSMYLLITSTCWLAWSKVWKILCSYWRRRFLRVKWLFGEVCIWIVLHLFLWFSLSWVCSYLGSMGLMVLLKVMGVLGVANGLGIGAWEAWSNFLWHYYSENAIPSSWNGM